MAINTHFIEHWECEKVDGLNENGEYILSDTQTDHRVKIKYTQGNAPEGVQAAAEPVIVLMPFEDMPEIDRLSVTALSEAISNSGFPVVSFNYRQSRNSEDPSQDLPTEVSKVEDTALVHRALSEARPVVYVGGPSQLSKVFKAADAARIEGVISLQSAGEDVSIQVKTCGYDSAATHRVRSAIEGVFGQPAAALA